MKRLNEDLPGRIVTAWATKQHTDRSYVRLTQAIPVHRAPCRPATWLRRTDVIYIYDDFKQQIADQLSALPQSPYGPLRMQISFTVGPAKELGPPLEANNELLSISSAVTPMAQPSGPHWMAASPTWPSISRLGPSARQSGPDSPRGRPDPTGSG